jgi:hypothetical protein
VVTPWATILDGELLAIRARHAAQLAAEHRRIAGVRQRAKDAIIVAQREARIAAQRAVAQAREAVTS